MASTSACWGLTGGIGSGKSAAAQLFEQHGAQVIDADAVAHQLTAAGGLAMTAIAQQFGQSMLSPDGSLNRTAMRELAFTDPTVKSKLEAILHPMIGTQIRMMLTRVPAERYALLVVPLFVESGRWFAHVRGLSVVDCPQELQIKRVLERSARAGQAMTSDRLHSIMASQATREQRLCQADYVLDNSGSLAQLEQRVTQLHQRFTQESTFLQATATI